MKKITSATLAAILSVLLVYKIVDAHCEIPCGIYSDKVRIALLVEHVDTIEKSMKMIKELAGKTDAQSVNQSARWVQNKEVHAKELQHIVTQYFMTQRVKVKDASDAEGYARYLSQLKPLHGMLVHGMKCKQTVDSAHCDKLRMLIDQFSASYFSAEDLEHLKGHHKNEKK